MKILKIYFSCCRRRIVNIESIHSVGSYIVVFYDVCDMGHGSCSVTSRSTVYKTLVVMVVIYWSFARVHDQCEICRTLCRPARRSLHHIRALARIG